MIGNWDNIKTKANSYSLHFGSYEFALIFHGNTAQLCLRAAAVFLPHFFSLKNEKYIQYSFVFQTLN